MVRWFTNSVVIILAGLCVMLSAPSPRAVADEPPASSPYEEVMREIQARHIYIHGPETPIDWPDCPGGGDPGPFPPDGFYGAAAQEPAFAANLVWEIVTEGLQYGDVDALYGYFIRLEEVDKIDAGTEANPGLEQYVDEDFPELFEGMVTGDYAAVFSLVVEIVEKLKYLPRGASPTEVQWKGGLYADAELSVWSDPPDENPCQIGYEEFEDGVDGVWANTSGTGGYIGVWEGENFCKFTDQEGTIWAVFQGFLAAAAKGKVQVSFQANGDTGSARVYLRTDPVGNGPGSHTPTAGLTADGKYHLWQTIESGTGATTIPDELGSIDSRPDLTYSCGNLPPCGCPQTQQNPPQDPPDQCMFGWFVHGAICIVEPEFDTTPSDPDECGVGDPVVKDDEAPNLGDAEGNVGGADGCGSGGAGGGPGAGGPGAGGPQHGGGPGGGGGQESTEAVTEEPDEDEEPLDNPESDNPIALAVGDKIYRATDLVVPITGPDFRVVREYRSTPELYSDEDKLHGLVGVNWTLSVFGRLMVESQGEDPPILHLGGPPMRGTLQYTYAGSSQWKTTGRTTQHFEESSIEIGETTWPTWKLIEPGRWEKHFIRAGESVAAGLVGRLIRETDVFGNSHTYEYRVYSTSSTTPNQATARLYRIYLNGEPEEDTEAYVEFSWHLGYEATPPQPEPHEAIKGRLHSIQVYRPAASGAWVLTHQVKYLYMIRTGATPGPGVVVVNPEEPDQLSDDLGTNGDLIQVRHTVRLDSATDAMPYRVSYTQHRYHDDDPRTGPVTGTTIDGAPHQLKMVLLPEQIEFLAKEWQGLQPTAPLALNVALEYATNQLLSMEDGEDAHSPFSATAGRAIRNYASKVLSYADGRVQHQYVQTSCGCSGGNASHGLRQAYEYVTYSGGLTTRVTDQVYDSGFQTLRLVSYDLERLGPMSIPYLVTKAIEEPDSFTNPRQWVWHYEYDSDRRMIRVMYPSGKDTYERAETAEPPVYEALDDAGLVVGYEYTDDHRLMVIKVGAGTSTLDLVKRINYPGVPLGSNERAWLPVSVERFRVAGSTSAGDVETTLFEHDFRGSTDAIAWTKISVEAETESENGPAGSGVRYDRYELFDERGRNVWTRAEDNALVFRAYAAGMGTLAQVTRNADPAGPNGVSGDALNGSNFEGISTTGWGTPTDGGELTTTYLSDLVGRVRERVGPGGVRSYTRRELREAPSRPDLLYFRTVELPHRLGSTGSVFDGPASVTWSSAGGQWIEMGTYTLDASGGYNPTAGVYELEEEEPLSRSVAGHSFAGVLDTREDWPDVSGSPYVTSYTYDALGRLKDVIDPNDTLRRRDAYDVLHRVTAVKLGVDGGTPVLAAEYFYDSDGTDTQGEGNGNLTLIRQYTGEEGTGALGPAERDTIRWFDDRDRLEIVERAASPHEFIEYDNLNRVVKRALFDTVPSGIGGTTESTRGLYVESLYSQRGMLYRQRVAIDSTDLGDGFLETNSWFDGVGRTIAEWAPNAPGVKRTFDGLGRTKLVYVTDRGGDAAPGASGNHADAAGLSGDRVLEQTGNTYTLADRLKLSSTRRRNHDAPLTDYGALDADNSVITYVGFVYDAANRQVGTINYGTNIASDNTFKTGGSDPTVPSTVPSSTDEMLVSSVAYNARGLVETSTDPKGRLTRYFFDDLSRRIAVAENWDDAELEWDVTMDRWEVTQGLIESEPDTDRVTSFVYDGAGNVVKQVAHLPTGTSEKVQITQYVYGTTVGSVSTHTDSLIASNGLLKEVRYPQESGGSAGQPGTTDAFKVKYAYNRSGELRSVTDQNGTRHAYFRDALGRVEADKVEAFGTNIDQHIERIGVSYDDFGRLGKVLSYEDASGSTIANGAEFTYTPLWQVSKAYQDHDGDVGYDGGGVPTGNTKVVPYAYDTLAPAGGTNGSNHSRLATLTYPDGAELDYGYGSAGDPDERISRAAAMAMPLVLPSSNVVEYARVGMDLFALVDYAAADVQLDRTFSQDGKRNAAGYSSQAEGHYPGWDRFGRVAIQAWMDGGLDDDTGSALPTRPPIVDEVYTYDRSSNRLSKTDARPGAKVANRDNQYEYDGLDRLTKADRGITGTTWTTGAGGQKWVLDMLGNWTEVREDLDGNGDYDDETETETRWHNEANEVVARDAIPSGDPPTQELPFAYDDSGNLRSATRPGAASDDVYTHDAWNRLVKWSIDDGETTTDFAEYGYNGLHWRTVKRVLPQTGGTSGEQRVMYYSASWQVLQEDVDAAYVSSPGLDKISQEVWGLRYIDDPVLRRSYDPDSEIEEQDTLHYHLTDVQFSSVAMIGTGANPVLFERVRYKPYGEARHHFPGDLDGDGDCDNTDRGIINGLIGGTGTPITSGSYDVACDLNRDGTINSSDYTVYTWWHNRTPLAAGRISDAGSSTAGPGPDNPFGFDGYVFNSEIAIYTVRFRWYDPVIGRWLQKDPTGYSDGMNVYALGPYANPTGTIDPTGLSCRPSDEDLSMRAEYYSRAEERRRSRVTTHIIFQIAGDQGNAGGTLVTSLREIADHIRTKCSDAKVDMITITGHGGAGQLLTGKIAHGGTSFLSITQLAEIKFKLTHMNKLSCEDAQNLLNTIDDLQTLGRCNKLDLVGCNVGADDYSTAPGVGSEFLQEMANFTGVPVKAPVCSVWDAAPSGGLLVLRTPVLGWFTFESSREMEPGVAERHQLEDQIQSLRERVKDCACSKCPEGDSGVTEKP